MMILSAEYSHPHNHRQDQMGATPCLPQTALHTPRHTMYAGYLMDPPPSWYNPMKQEPEDNSVNNDSGISPSHYNSDGSVQNTSPKSCHSEARSDDSGHPDREDQQTNATLGVLARPIMDTPSSPRHASIGFLAQPILGGSPSPNQAHSPAQRSPQQRVPSPPQHMSPPSQQLSPCQTFSPHLNLSSPKQHSTLSFLPPGDSTPQSPRQQYSPQQPAHSSQQPAHSSNNTTPNDTLCAKPTDDNSRSSASSTEMDMYYEDPLRGLQMALQRRGMMGPLPTESPVNGEKPLQCPLCQYSTTIRSAFNNHLMSEHSEQVSCHLCEYTAENHTKLKEHLRLEHDTQLGPEDEWGDDDEAGVTTPKVNSQGKVKTYRCKQCEFCTVTKLEFWEHTRSHIKPERLLTCPKCPFVTEYKHHLEYHLRNHFGSKPFKCDKCSYSCVNKSMLNSHLKSHSNVYQFRCADCAYATKYCHSLKLHLRKYNHNPAMVLNPDGSPNPLPIVDVYGTRRGPKRPRKPEEISSPQQPALPTLHPMFSSPYGFLPSQTISYPYNTYMNTFHRNPINSFANHSMQDEPIQPKTEYENNFFSAAMSTIQQSTINNNQEGVKEYLTRVISTQQEIIARTGISEEDTTKASLSVGTPLDLSRPEPEQQEEPVEPNVDQVPDQTVITKSRRKGKAFKLERIAQRLQQQSSDEEECEPSPKQPRLDLPQEHTKVKVEEEEKVECEGKAPLSPRVNFCEPVNGEFKSSISEERKTRWKNVKEVYDCAYCDMLFGDVVMYTMHMGYHGYQNPFTCNMCGHQTSDKVQFFLHLFRFAHG